jgi:hypothetical protein
MPTAGYGSHRAWSSGHELARSLKAQKYLRRAATSNFRSGIYFGEGYSVESIREFYVTIFSLFFYDSITSGAERSRAGCPDCHLRFLNAAYTQISAPYLQAISHYFKFVFLR